MTPPGLVFIDETAVSTNMARIRGRAPRGVRVIGHVPLGEWKTITFVAGLRHNRMTAPMVVDGPMTVSGGVGGVASELLRAPSRPVSRQAVRGEPLLLPNRETMKP